MAKTSPEVQATPPSPAERLLTSIIEDVTAVMRNDPAARSAVEVLLAYPGLHAIWLHRLTHPLWQRGQTTCARLLSHLNRSLTGIEIHPGAQLGRRVFIDHGMGVVIGETAVIGDGCLIYKGVVLGGTRLEQGKRHPTLGAGVVVGSNACILGDVVIGDHARIGSGSVVVRDVPAKATAVGVPSRIVSTVEGVGPLDHGALPDPIATVMRSLLDEVAQVRARVAALEAALEAAQGGAVEEEDDPQRRLAEVFFEHGDA